MALLKLEFNTIEGTFEGAFFINLKTFFLKVKLRYLPVLLMFKPYWRPV